MQGCVQACQAAKMKGETEGALTQPQALGWHKWPHQLGSKPLMLHLTNTFTELSCAGLHPHPGKPQYDQFAGEANSCTSHDVRRC